VEPMTYVLVALAALLAVGCVLLARKTSALSSQLAVSESKAESLVRDADSQVAQARKEAELESKQAATEARGQMEKENEEVRQRLKQDEGRIRERREDLDRRASRSERREQDLERREGKLGDRQKEVDALDAELAALRDKAIGELEELSELSREDAREQLIARVEEESRPEMARRLKELEDEVHERSEETAKNILSMAIQRYAGEYVCERTVSVVALPSDELKGRIIGREGRNIRVLEAATGVDFIIDDTPDTIVISAFNPIRREVAKMALETLLEDGRIHPSRIESVVRKAEADFHRIIKAAGDEAADEVGVSGVHPEILKLIGALKYRTSYGQNQWKHAVEVSFLSGMMAGELGLDVTLAKRAGLLHDIGKVLDQTAEGSHALIGAEFARKHRENKIVVNAIASHHEEVPQETIYAVLAQAADAMSGARPGARREMMQNYTKRLTDLERISNSFPGVDRSYAVQAGREVRILVENARVTDEEAVMLSSNIARKIESEMSYPGQIKVTVIRETRVVQYAR
jgi:ribonucrease Y